MIFTDLFFVWNQTLIVINQLFFSLLKIHKYISMHNVLYFNGVI